MTRLAILAAVGLALVVWAWRRREPEYAPGRWTEPETPSRNVTARDLFRWTPGWTEPEDGMAGVQVDPYPPGLAGWWG